MSFFLFRVGLCSHGIFLLQVTWPHQSRRRSTQRHRSRGPESTRSSWKHVLQKGFKWDARWAICGKARKHGSSSDGCDVFVIGCIVRSPYLHQTAARFFVIGGILRSTDLHLTAAIIQDLGDARGDITIGESPSDGRCRTSLIVRSGSPNLPDLDRTADGKRARTTIAARSGPDHGAIGIPLRRNQGHDPSRGFRRRSFEHQHQDQRPIAARSWLDRGSGWSGIKANSARDWSHDAAQWRPLPRCIKSAPTTASIAHDLPANFPFKKPCILPLFFNYWSIREEIKRISRKIYSSLWSPHV